MSKPTYAEKLLDPRWQKKRLEVLTRDEFKCYLCADEETTLHVHHYCYPKSRNPWDSDLDDLITYCKHCHALVESTDSEMNVLCVLKQPLNGGNLCLVATFLDSENEVCFAFYTYHSFHNTVELNYTLSRHSIQHLSDSMGSYHCKACGKRNDNENHKCNMCGYVRFPKRNKIKSANPAK